MSKKIDALNEEKEKVKQHILELKSEHVPNNFDEIKKKRSPS